MGMNEIMLGIEGLIDWGVFIIKWSLITAMVSSIIVFVLICTLYVMKLNNIKLPNIALHWRN